MRSSCSCWRRALASSKRCLLDGRRLLGRDLLELPLQLADRGGGHPVADLDLGGSLVHHIDGLVRQEPIGDVATGQLGGSRDGLVGDVDFVMVFVALADALEDLDRFLDGRFAHLHGLETPLQGRVALNVFAVFVQCGRADDLQARRAPGRA